MHLFIVEKYCHQFSSKQKVVQVVSWIWLDKVLTNLSYTMI